MHHINIRRVAQSNLRNGTNCYIEKYSNIILMHGHFIHYLQEEDFQDMISRAQAMENKYGHLFEKVIINDDLAMAFTELRDELTKIETETRWIPNTWAHV